MTWGAFGYIWAITNLEDVLELSLRIHSCPSVVDVDPLCKTGKFFAATSLSCRRIAFLNLWIAILLNHFRLQAATSVCRSGVKLSYTRRPFCAGPSPLQYFSRGSERIWHFANDLTHCCAVVEMNTRENSWVTCKEHADTYWLNVTTKFMIRTHRGRCIIVHTEQWLFSLYIGQSPAAFLRPNNQGELAPVLTLPWAQIRAVGICIQKSGGGTELQSDSKIWEALFPRLIGGRTRQRFCNKLLTM